VEFPVLFAATLRVNAVLELDPPMETDEAALARLKLDTLVENMVAELSVVVMSPPFTARSPAIVRELEPVANTSPEEAPRKPLLLNCIWVFDPVGGETNSIRSESPTPSRYQYFFDDPLTISLTSIDLNLRADGIPEFAAAIEDETVSKEPVKGPEYESTGTALTG
jgi:hypothetical protein